MISTLFLSVIDPLAKIAEAATTITFIEPLGGDDKVAEGKDYATEVFSDPWDMSNQEDVAPMPAANFTNYGFSGGNWEGRSTSNDPSIWLVWFGYPGSLALGRDGVNNPINASLYNNLSIRMYSDTATIAELYWFYDQNINSWKASPGILILPGWNTYNLSFVYNGNWTGNITGLRFDPTNQANVNIKIDWIRLTSSASPNTGVNVEWNDSDPGGTAQVYIDNDTNTANGMQYITSITSNATNNYSCNSFALPPGTYYVYVKKSSTNAAYSGPFSINQTPCISITEPDASGGEDYATAVLGNSWNMSETGDIWEHYNVKDISIDTDEASGSKVYSATNYDEPITPTGANDPSVYPQTPISIDTSKYHRVSIRYKYEGSFDLVRGTMGRFVWLVDGHPTEFQVTDDIVTYEGWNTYTFDLRTANLDLGNYGWIGTINRFRFDPHEDPYERRFHIDYIKLAADDQAGSFFDIRWNHLDSDNDDARVSIYWDNDNKGFDGHLIDGDIKENIGSNVYRWLVSGMPSGTYYVYLKVEDSLNTNYVYSTGPVRIGSLSSQQSSFSEVMGTSASQLSTHYYFPWYDLATPGMQGAWILVGNPSDTNSATVSIKIGGETKDTKVLAPGARWTPRFSGELGGPVEIVSDQQVIASQRVLYMGAFNEVMGTRQEDLGSNYYFTWYDYASPGMNGNWILVSNVGVNPANVSIKIAGQTKASKTVSPGESWTPSFKGVINGPVEVISDQNVIASQRVLYKNSFNEVMGTRQEDLGSNYYFTWYDYASPGMNGNWILVSNVGVNPANVSIKIAGQTKASKTVSPGESWTPSFKGVINGPVEVISDQNVIASQRVLCSGSY